MYVYYCHGGLAHRFHRSLFVLIELAGHLESASMYCGRYVALEKFFLQPTSCLEDLYLSASRRTRLAGSVTLTKGPSARESASNDLG